MKRMKRLVAGMMVAFVLGLLALSAASPALAHNAGHIHTPNGECVNVGAGNEAKNEEQDKYPNTPYPQADEFGARWAADQGNSRVFPRHCENAQPHDGYHE